MAISPICTRSSSRDATIASTIRSRWMAPHLLNPSNGWIMNTNDWPYSAAGAQSPKREDYPRYMDTVGENPRGIHATMVLQDKKDFTLATLNAAAYDTYLPAFERLI